jgi:OmpA-OmpF porin, OOP family
MRSVALFSSAVALCLALQTTPSLAQSGPAPLAGFALGQFEPSPAGDRFFAVPDAQARGLLEIHESLLFQYAHWPLHHSLQNGRFLTEQFFGHLDASAVVAETFLLNFDVPVALHQEGEAQDGAASSGVGDTRVSLRTVFHSTQRHVFDASLQLDFWLPTGDENDLLGEGRVRFNPKVVAGGSSGHFIYTSTAGFVFRDHHTIGTGEVGNAVTFGVGFGALLLHRRLQIGPELYGSSVVVDGASFLSDASTPVEAMLGAKLRIGDFVVGAGAARGVTRGPGAAQVRAMISLAHTFDDRVLDRDGDGFNDDMDRCPNDPGFGSGGCPLSDSDGDTVFDTQDACPSQPGLVHADPQENGCPP